MATAAPTWSWANLPEDEDLREDDAIHSFDHHTEGSQEGHDEEEDTPPQPQKHYPPRTCRICFDEVLPTFDIPTGGMPSILNPKPKVRYVSDDPEAGRLIRPCKCRGTQQYVHEGCLQQWRHSDSNYGARTYWECPTCKFKYNLERMKWGRLLSSTFLQIAITIAIMFSTVFVFGFIADPIINLWLDPYDTITSIPTEGTAGFFEAEDASWAEHFIKGLASLGLLGFVQVFFAMSPWHWWNIRSGFGGGRRARRGGGGTGRDRLEDISWIVVIVGVITFLMTIWSWVRAWTARTLESAGERVLDVQGDEDDGVESEEFTVKPEAPLSKSTRAPTTEDAEPSTEPEEPTEHESKKTQ